MALRTLTFNKIHKNGWLSWKLAGVPGAVFVDKRMLDADTLANPPQTLELDIPGMVEPGADATAKQAAASAKKVAAEAARMERAQKAAAKAAEKLAKLQETATKAQAILDAAKAKVDAATVAPAETPAAE
jgi:hypothetical protein